MTTIGDNAFASHQLTSVTIPGSVTIFQPGAFYNNQLASVTIPDGVTTIGQQAFRRNQLTSVTIPYGMTTIGLLAFSENHLASAAFEGNRPSLIWKRAFENNPDLTLISYCLSSTGWPSDPISNGSVDITPMGIDCDSDGDGVGDNADTDDDGDGVLDASDAFPLDATEALDTDADGTGNNSDADDDGDGVSDFEDAFPLDASEFVDTDGDGVGDNADLDDDGDGMPDSWEIQHGYGPLTADDEVRLQFDEDGDGLTLLQESVAGTDPIKLDTDFDTLPDGWEVDNLRDPMEADYLIDAGVNWTCVADDSQIHCWGGSTEIKSFPRLTSLIDVSVGIDFCRSDPSLVCSALGQFPNYEAPTNPAPSNIWSTGWGHCLEDSDGFQCWGPEFQQPIWENPPDLHGVISFDAEHRSACAIDQDGLHCWGEPLDEGYYGLEENYRPKPPLVNPREVATPIGAVCAIDEEGVKCWGNEPFESDLFTIPNLRSPRNLVAGEGFACVIDDPDVVCWGNNSNGNSLAKDIAQVPVVKGPARIAAGTFHACVFSQEGVSCWGLETGSIFLPTPSNLTFDSDGDGYSSQEGRDAFPLDGSEWSDADKDGLGDNSDSFPFDHDNDGLRDDSDADDDNDGVLDINDALPLDASETLDTDSDGTGNNADTDDDGDGVPDTADGYALISLGVLLDTDSDGFPNECDEDCLATGMTADSDDDNDGVEDTSDAFPLDSSLWSLKVEDVLAEISDKNLRGCVEKAVIGLIQVADLTVLDCSERDIVNLTGLQKFIWLTKPELRFNQIADLSSLLNQSNLLELGLQGNPIDWLTFPEGLTGIQILRGNGTKLDSTFRIPSYLALTLKDLDISYQNTDLMDLAGLSLFSKLERLNFSGNPSIDWSSLPALANVTFLGAHGTGLERLSQLLPSAGNLETADLSNNKIIDLALIDQLVELKHLN
ncbi:leucine-rich repeat protein, partial [Pseudomonadales bacterium]|nr:leucine-rich repeat protein [Pseudomonadales bacterium]